MMLGYNQSKKLQSTSILVPYFTIIIGTVQLYLNIHGDTENIFDLYYLVLFILWIVQTWVYSVMNKFVLETYLTKFALI